MGIQGKLIDLSLPDIFQVVSIGKRSGKLVIKGEQDKANIIFDCGRIVQASIDNYKKNIGGVLIEKSFLTEENLFKAIQIQKTLIEWKQLGSVCFENGFITKEELEEAVKSLITDVVTELLSWREGTFNFDPGEAKMDDDISLDMKELIVRSGLSSDFVILEGARLLDEKNQEIRKDEFEKLQLASKRSQDEEAESEKSRKESLTDFAKGILGDLDLSFFEELAFKDAMFNRVSSKNLRGVVRIYSEIKSLKEIFKRSDENMLFHEFSLSAMRYASEIAQRVVLFIVRDGFAYGMGHMGLYNKENSTMDEEIRTLKVSLDKPSLLSKVYDTKETYCGEIEGTPWDNFIMKKIGGGVVGEVLVSPIAINGEIKLILYADDYPSRESLENIEELEAFIYQAGMALEIALLKISLKKSEKG